MRTIQTFEVSLKAFIVRDRRVLFVREADTGYWELPGGRIDAGEERVAHDLVLARELAEELGAGLRVAPTDRAATFWRQRPGDGVFQVIVARECRYLSGEPRLSAEHAGHVWADPATWGALEFPPLSGYGEALARLARIAFDAG